MGGRGHQATHDGSTQRVGGKAVQQFDSPFRKLKVQAGLEEIFFFGGGEREGGKREAEGWEG